MDRGSRFAPLIKDEVEALVQLIDFSSYSLTKGDSSSMGVTKDKCKRSTTKCLSKTSMPRSDSPP